jgi:hypothetical protein
VQLFAALLFHHISHTCAKKGPIMKTITFLLLILLYLLCRPFSRTLKSLPNNNDDFMLF